jgi:hypothetical protein
MYEYIDSLHLDFLDVGLFFEFLVLAIIVPFFFWIRSKRGQAWLNNPE